MYHTYVFPVYDLITLLGFPPCLSVFFFNDFYSYFYYILSSNNFKLNLLFFFWILKSLDLEVSVIDFTPIFLSSKVT